MDPMGYIIIHCPYAQTRSLHFISLTSQKLRQRQAAGDMNKQTKTYYGRAPECAPVCQTCIKNHPEENVPRHAKFLPFPDKGKNFALPDVAGI